MASKKKCDFVKMGTKIIPRRTSDKEKTKKILEDRDKRKKAWREWLR